MAVWELRKLRKLKVENAQLKKLVEDLSMDKQMLQDILKKVLNPSQRRTMVTASFLIIEFPLAEHVGYLC